MKIPKENIILAIISITLLLLTYFFDKQLPFSVFDATLVIVIIIIPLGKWFISKKVHSS